MTRGGHKATVVDSHDAEILARVLDSAAVDFRYWVRGLLDNRVDRWLARRQDRVVVRLLRRTVDTQPPQLRYHSETVTMKIYVSK
jgi:hypothetical protein